MDIYDVSGSDQYLQLLARQKEVLKAARARQGERPEARSSRQELVDGFMMQHTIQQLGRLKTRDTAMTMHSSFVPPPYPPAIAPLGELKQMFVKDLQLETHHRGNYLLVRSITPPNRMTAIMAIVTDEREDAVMLQLYQQDDRNDQPATSVMKQDDVFLVKEPYFKVMADGEYGLRIDHLSDLVRLEAHDEKLPEQWGPRVVDVGKTAEDWKLEGNAAMRRHQYWIAIENYTTALGCPTSNQEEKALRLNRALAYLKDGYFDAALADSTCLTSSSDAPEKALYRAGQALYKLGRFSECQDVLTLLCRKYPSNADAIRELTRIRCRLEEQRGGVYDFKAIYEEASKLRPPHLDHATFIGPVVIKATRDRGRGLFTTKPVKAGDLVLCEKAFAHCYANTEEGSTVSSKISVLLNPQTNRMSIGTQTDLITAIVQKLWRNPSLLPEFKTLHHGSYKSVNGTEVDGRPIIDTFLIERVISLNVFGCPLSSRESNFTAAVSKKKHHHSCGIWLTASSINHSCFSNVRRSFIGDLQLVHAARDIPADTELTFWYHIPTGGRYEETQRALQGWGFECDCAICLDAKNTPKKLLKRRDALQRDLKTTLLNTSGIDAAKAERLIAAIEQTYKSPPSKIPRFTLWNSYLRLARVYAGQGQPAKTVSMALQALESLGFVIKGAHLASISTTPFEIEQWGVMEDDVVEAWIHLRNTYATLAPHMAQKAEESAKVAYKICCGEDATFGELGAQRHR